MVVYRKRVFHRTRKNFQLDLFSPDNGHYEYSAVVTNKDLGISSFSQRQNAGASHTSPAAQRLRSIHKVMVAMLRSRPYRQSMKTLAIKL